MVTVGIEFGHAWQDNLVQQAWHAFHRGDYEAAEELWLAISEDIEGYAWEANFFLGITYLRTENMKEAEDYMVAAYDRRPKHYRLRPRKPRP